MPSSTPAAADALATARRASERRFRALAAAMGDAVWTASATGETRDDADWRRLTGQTSAEARGDGWLAAVHPDDRAQVATRWAEALAARTRYEAEYRLRLADGSWRRMRARGVPVLDDDGCVVEWVGTLDDVEEWRHTEDALHAMRREAEAYAEEAARLMKAEHRARVTAEAANRAKSDFLGMMSHELRTPLNAITGYVDILELELHGPITERQRADLLRIRRGAQVLMTLVHDVLGFARLEAGQVEFQLDDVPVAAALGELEALVLPQLVAAGLDHTFAVGAGTPTLYADPERLQQILLNLITNAIKFTPAGGSVTVTAEAAEDVVHVRVRDTGRGIATDQLERIFEPFVQVDRHLARDGDQGAGLGLAISRDLARAMGGELTAASVPGEGATFTLTLPRGRARG